jgi:hypothetical protein
VLSRARSTATRATRRRGSHLSATCAAALRTAADDVTMRLPR